MKPLVLFLLGLVLGGVIGGVAGTGLGAPEEAAHVHDDSHPHTPEELAAAGPDAPRAAAGTDHAAHAAPLDVSGDGPAPTVALDLVPVAGGQSLHIRTENFAFAPAAVDGPAAPGEGHAHVYADGVKILRALGPWIDLPGLAPGTEIRVDLVANSHETLALGTEPISGTILIPAP